MKAIILPGNSKKSNEIWVDELKDGLMSCFDEVTAMHYDHWNSGEDMDFESEKRKAKEILGGINGDYAIIAKSVGIVITMTLIKEEKTTPKYCIFSGLPMDEDTTGPFTELKNMLKRYSIPTVFIQNPDERFIKPEQLREVLSNLGVKKFEVVNGKGQEHSYTVGEIVEVAQEMNKKYENN
ncbi:MAG: hypothetical protein CMH62_00210 [Nanoarchaeota archaeon]|nr:hypothetical protein [Nanoarchaeota archaeon]|tara:strand:+ start:222 stop:764 length:543 start_codon:yes stop_codon:yes gene_type:complete